MSPWWLALPLAAAPEPVTFDAAVHRALERAPAVQLAQYEVSRAQALTEQSRAPSLPTLFANGSYTRLEGDRTLNGNVVAAANQLGANLQLQVPLFAPARWAQWRRAELSADLTRLSAEETRRQTALQVGRTWLTLLAQHRVTQAQQRSVDVAAAHLKYARDRLAGGIGNKLDASRAAQELAVARAQVASAQAGVERLQEQLGLVVGVDAALDSTDAEPELPVGEAKVAERPDVKLAQGRVAAAENSQRWNWGDFAPLLTAVVTPAVQNPPTVTQPMLGFQAQLVLSLPLYEGGLRYGPPHERPVLTDQAQLQLEAQTRQASAEVRTALTQVQRADEALQASRDAAAQALEALTLAQDTFRAGGATNLEVIDAERRARDAETAVALAENASRQARLELLAASGRWP